MIEAPAKYYTFAEYLNYKDGTDRKHELFNGKIITMPPASGIHALIRLFLFKQFDREIERLALNWQVMPGTIGVRTASVLVLVDGFYEVTEFTGEEKIISPTFPQLQLTVKQLFDVDK